MSATVKTNIEYVEEEILDERKVSLKALVSIQGKVEEINSLEIIKGIEEKEDLQILKETVKYKEVLGRETSYAIVKEVFELGDDKPSIEEILKVNIQAYDSESVVEGRIIISGTAIARITLLWRKSNLQVGARNPLQPLPRPARSSRRSPIRSWS